MLTRHPDSGFQSMKSKWNPELEFHSLGMQTNIAKRTSSAQTLAYAFEWRNRRHTTVPLSERTEQRSSCKSTTSPFHTAASYALMLWLQQCVMKNFVCHRLVNRKALLPDAPY